jgi:hypothetical protein
MTDEKIKNWNHLSNKIPKINKDVFILKKSKDTLYSARLRVYSNNLKRKAEGLEEGDLYWAVYAFKDKCVCWAPVENFPHWMEKKDILKLVVSGNEKIVEKVTRNDLLDFED